MQTDKLLIVTVVLFTSLGITGLVAWDNIQKDLVGIKMDMRSQINKTNQEVARVSSDVVNNMTITENYVAELQSDQNFIKTDLNNAQRSLQASINSTNTDVFAIREKTDIFTVSQEQNRLIFEPTNRVEKTHHTSNQRRYSNPNIPKTINLIETRILELDKKMRDLKAFEASLKHQESRINRELDRFRTTANRPPRATSDESNSMVSFREYDELRTIVESQNDEIFALRQQMNSDKSAADRKLNRLVEQQELEIAKLNSKLKDAEKLANNSITSRPSIPKTERYNSAPKTANIGFNQKTRKCSGRHHSRKFSCIKTITVEFDNIGYEHDNVRLVITSPDGSVLVNRSTENNGGSASFEILIQSNLLEKGLYTTNLYSKNKKLKDEHFSI